MKNKFAGFFLLIVLFTISKNTEAQSRIPYAIIPQPERFMLRTGTFDLTAEVEIVCNEACVSEAQFFVEWLSNATGQQFSLVGAETWRYTKPFILFKSETSSTGQVNIADQPHLHPDYAALINNSPQEGYTISIDERGISVSALAPIGIFHAVQSLRQMFPPKAENKQLRLPHQLNCAIIHDQPHFSHRGLNLDCCRHFMTVDFIKKYIDLLAYYKMNIFHWHLTEDQGWRIEIEKYPKLTEIGAFRVEEDGSTYGGFYKKSEIKDIVAYAAARHITIIPEIEMPGHSVAAIASYHWLGCTKTPIEVENQWGVFKDIYCAGNDSTFQFMEDVLTEICELFPGEYIHIGGDEAPKFRWENCDKCQHRMKEEHLENEAQLQTYFINRISAFLATKGKKIIGWDEILEGGIPNGAMIQSWRGMEGGIEAAKSGHQVVMSPTSHCYFDYDIKSIDTEKVYYFDPIPSGLTAAQKAYITGGECNMWTEHAPQELVDQKLFPRLPALAEVLWTYNENRQYIEFESRLQKHYSILEFMDTNYGFAKLPIEFQTSQSGNSLTLGLKLNPADLNVKYGFAKEKITNSYKEPISIANHTHVFAQVTSNTGKTYPETFEILLWPSLSLGQPLQLNYTPSKYYTGGGSTALVDGVLGSLDFRDGHWQASTQGDLEAIVSLSQPSNIRYLSMRAFHYANAWIFRPESITYEYSMDGKNWTTAGTIVAPFPAQQSGQEIVPFELKLDTPIQAQYIKATAKSIGKCPGWHDAVGEPSWIFWDEITVKN